MDKPALYLIPTLLGDTPVSKVIPPYNIEVASRLKYFIVENTRTARRFLKRCDPSIDIDGLTFFELNKHTNPHQIASFLKPLTTGESMGVLSEAGCPAVADPGADVVAIAQREGYQVIPLVGPSSLLMALMGSGFNGQSFAFHGYLPIDPGERAKKLKRLEMLAYSDDQTQLFIETPYRNQKLAEEILRQCKPKTRLCIAMNLSLPDAYLVTRTVQAWKGKLPNMHKKPAVFLIYKE
ncbi:MAG TPA: SAM-dependent methyltransferase [Bacteroidales bacterium]|jgi:16S rRNA (cytidine1402-2'-O)-methyltransferase|nr:SAM-dependent methyltransferase [Bacteroidales bacterium]